MKNLLPRICLGALTLLAAPAFAQVVRVPVVTNSAGSPMPAGASVLVGSNGTEKGTSGNPVVTSCPGCAASSSSQLPATLGPKSGALSLSVVPNTDTTFPVSGTVATTQSGTWLTGVKGNDGTTISGPTNGISILGTKLNDGTQSSTGGTHLTMGGVDTGTNVYRPMLVDSSGRVQVGYSQPSTTSYRQLALTAATRAQLASQITGMVNGVVCTAAASNTTNVLVGGSAVTVTEDGTGNGYPMIPGGSYSEGLSTTAGLYFISTAGAAISCHGN